MNEVKRTVESGDASRGMPTGMLGYFRRADAARYLGVSVRQLSVWTKAGLVACGKMSHKVCLYKLADLDAAFDRMRVGAVGEAA